MILKDLNPYIPVECHKKEKNLEGDARSEAES